MEAQGRQMSLCIIFRPLLCKSQVGSTRASQGRGIPRETITYPQQSSGNDAIARIMMRTAIKDQSKGTSDPVPWRKAAGGSGDVGREDMPWGYTAADYGFGGPDTQWI